MRIGSIRLSWFRGAAAEAVLEPNGGSLVVFGPNGAGKSSFVDGVEVCIQGGKVTHLAHQYSGRHQEKGLINTHRPPGEKSTVTVTLTQGECVTCQWTGVAPQITGLDRAPLGGWDYRRTALRQDEIAEFIKSTKAEKYSALLPLLGLQHLEVAADNLRKLQREIETLGKLAELRRDVALVEQRRRELFGSEQNAELLRRLNELRRKHLGPEHVSQQTPEAAAAILEVLQTRLNSLDAESREAAALQAIARNDVPSLIAAARSVGSEIARVTEPLVKERLEVLGAAGVISEQLAPEVTDIACPACGTSVKAADFRAHVASERERLEAISQLFDRQRIAIAAVCDEVSRLRTEALKNELSDWRAAQGEQQLAPALDYVTKLDVRLLREACGEDDLATIERHFASITAAAAAAARRAAPDVQELIRDQQHVTAIKAVLDAAAKGSKIKRGETLVACADKLEAEVRAEIRVQAERVFGSISADIQRLWDILIPNKRITDVRLHVPGDADKAIDVALAFHGVEQESPRLTLSEGQRNALGLCIFLAMAKQDRDDRPIILDDVVISLDRDHRSNVAELLDCEFKDRQIIVLTHEREWYFELTRRLRKPHWSFARLLPWVDPATGIRRADHPLDFEKARANVDKNPEDALSNVRRIMDVALAEVAERLEIPMPYLRGDQNDHRTAGQFIIAIIKRGSKAFRVRSAEVYEKNVAALAALEAVAPQLSIWANRGTHTFSAGAAEARLTIDNCERALRAFACDDCGTPVGFIKTERGDLECRCGKLQWRRE